MFSLSATFSSIISIFWFLAHFILLSFPHIILVLGKKWARLFLIPPMCNIFLFFFGSLGFYSFPILRWDLLRLFGEANGRESNFRFSVLFSNSYVFLKFFFEFSKWFLEYGKVYWFRCASRVRFFFDVFRVFLDCLRPKWHFFMPKKNAK